MIRGATVLFIAATVAAPFAQAPDSTELEAVLRQAEARRQEYRETFRDLTAVETRFTEVFDRSGQVEKRRTVVSDFFVYRSELKDGIAGEYRIVREVDGKPVRNPSEDAIKLFQRLARAKTRERELERLNQANVKYMLRYMQWGATLNALGLVTREDRRADFEFALMGRERVDGRDANVLRYQTRTMKPVGPQGLYREFKRPRTGGAGRAWLDATDGRLLRWETDLTVADGEDAAPVVLTHNEISYGPSTLGVFTPTRIVSSLFEKTSDKKAPGVMRLAARLTFTYDAFRRFEVTTDTDIQLPKAP